MKKIIWIFSLAVFLGLVGCATFHNNDPDGDHDAKGTTTFPVAKKATGNRVFIFDPKNRAWAVYDEKGHRKNTGKASGGAVYCADVGRPCRTIVGKFRIISKGGSSCESSSFPIETGGGAPMPYCMHFNPSYAIHGSYDVPNYNASHGCIRVTPTVAKWLNTKFMRVGSTVIVKPY